LRGWSLWRKRWSLKSRRCRPSIGLRKWYRISPIREVWMLVPTRVIRIRVWVMVLPGLEVVHIGNILNMGRGKWVSYLAIFSQMF